MPVTVDNADVTPDEVEEFIAGLRERFASLKGVERPVQAVELAQRGVPVAVGRVPPHQGEVGALVARVELGHRLPTGRPGAAGPGDSG